MGLSIGATGGDPLFYNLGPGLEALHLLGDTEAESARNRARGGIAGTWFGTPTLAGAYADTIATTSALTTAVHEAAAFTAIVVCRPTDSGLTTGDDDPVYLSTNTGPAAVAPAATINGVSLYTQANTGALTLYVNRWGGVTHGSAPETSVLSGADKPPLNAWTIACVRVDNTQQEIRDFVRAKYQLETGKPSRDVTTRNWRVGGRWSGSTVGEARTAAAAIFSGWLDDTALAFAAGRVKAICEARGVTF